MTDRKSPSARADVIADEPARIITSSEGAIDAANTLAASWAKTAAGIDAGRTVPVTELHELGRSGLLAITIPREHGGPGLRTTTLIEVFRILAATDTALAQVPQNHFDFLDALANAGPDTQRRFYGEVLRGARFGNAIAEPGRKSRRDLATTIVEDGDGYRINGTKYFSTGALTAQWVPVLALHADGRIRTAYLPRDAEGLEVLADWDAFGQRATFSGTTIITNVRVPRDHVVDRTLGHAGFLAAQFAGNQLIHAAIETGSAEGALVRAADMLKNRGGHPREVDLARLGDLAVRTAGARALVSRAARLVDAALEAVRPSKEAAVAACIAVDEAKSIAYALGPAVTNELLHFSTRAGAQESLRLDRFWRNARTHSLHDPLRWRQHYVGDYHLNGRLSKELAGRFEPRQPAHS